MTCEVVKIGSSARITIEGVVDERGAALLKERFRDLSREQFNELIIDMGASATSAAPGLVASYCSTKRWRPAREVSA